MTTTTAPASSTVTSPFAALLDKTPAEKAKDSSTASSDRFLTMLVTQLQNQDPLNPMDNAQITSQMAQINAVTGLDKVNESVKSLGSQFLQMQLTQGAGLVGREVAFEGDRLNVTSGVGRGGFELAGASGSTKVEVLDTADRVVATLDLGPQSAGRHDFNWSLGNKPAGVDYHFRVSAALGKAAVAGRTLVLDQVQSVSTANDSLSLTLARNGTIAASDVVAYH